MKFKLSLAKRRKDFEEANKITLYRIKKLDFVEEYEKTMEKIVRVDKAETERQKGAKQAGAELGQAQLQLELGFTLIKVCCITLIITNYHYISLSTIGLSFVTSTYLHTSLLNCYLPCLLAYLLSYIYLHSRVAKLSSTNSLFQPAQITY